MFQPSTGRNTKGVLVRKRKPRRGRSTYKKAPEQTPDALTRPYDPDVVHDLSAYMQKTLSARAQSRAWPEPGPTLAITYTNTLIYGNGRRPRDIPGYIGDNVEALFVKGCILFGVPRNVLMGQRQKWFNQLYRKALHCR